MKRLLNQKDIHKVTSKRQTCQGAGIWFAAGRLTAMSFLFSRLSSVVVCISAWEATLMASMRSATSMMVKNMTLILTMVTSMMMEATALMKRVSPCQIQEHCGSLS